MSEPEASATPAVQGLLGVIRTARAQALRLIAGEEDADDRAQTKRDLPLTIDVIEHAVIAALSAPEQAARTPSSRWHANGEPDPHDSDYYDQQRAQLCMGDLTDDELANGAFLNYDRHPSAAEMVAGKPTPAVWMTAVKDRIRWLSRALEKALAAQQADARDAARTDAECWEQGKPDSIDRAMAYEAGTWFHAESVDEMQAFYRARLPAIREAAREHGYAIGVHGSERRDFDLIACPWRDGASDPDTLAHAVAMAACGITREGAYDWTEKPLGRIAVSIPVCWTARRGVTNDGHIDLSVALAATAASKKEG